MSYYQLTQLQLAALCFGLVVVLLGYSLLKRRENIPYAVLVGTLVGILGACFFTVSYLTADSGLPRVTQVAVKFLRDLPIILTVCYACMVQAKRYSIVRDESSTLCTWFERSWWVIGAAFLSSATLEFVLRPPVLESDESLPPATLFADAAVLVPLATYAALCCSVFVRTLWRNREMSDWARRLQNLCGGLALGGLTALAIHTLVWRAVRVLVPEDQLDPIVEQLSTNQVAIISIVAISILVGLASYSSEGRTETLTDGMEDVLRAFESITENVASVSVSAEGLNVTYAALKRATNEDMLGLTSHEKCLVDSAFRAVLVTEGVRGHPPQHQNPITREQLLSVSEFYEKEIANSGIAEKIGQTSDERLPDSLRSLFLHPQSANGTRNRDDFYAVVKLLLEIVGEKDPSRPWAMSTWAQLVCVALDDAGVLTHRPDRITAPGSRSIQGTVVDAYNLAKYEIENCRLVLQ